MLRIAKILTLLFLTVLVTIIGLFLVTPPDPNSYLATSIDKQKRLSALTSPKIVFVGGSNLAFGLDSELIAAELGLPVQNMGLHAGLGLNFMLKEVREHLRKGDLVVVAPEYQHFLWSYFGAGEAIDVVRLKHDNFKYMKDFEQFVNLFLESVPRAQAYLKEHLTGVRSSSNGESDGRASGENRRKLFNRSGDYVGHLGLENPVDIRRFELFVKAEKRFDMASVQGLNLFFRDVKKRGANAVLMFPGLSEYHYHKNCDFIEMIYHEIRKKIEMPVLGEPADFVFATKLFFDTAYHLNRAGRRLRTERILRFLRTIPVEPMPRTGMQFRKISSPIN